MESDSAPPSDSHSVDETEDDSDMMLPSPCKKRKIGRAADGKPFSDSIKRKLVTLYYAGMDGWGKKHQSQLETAMTSTGLTLEQVKVLAYLHVS